MDASLLKSLEKITEEEQNVLDGRSIDPSLYFSSEDNIIDSQKLLQSGRLIQVRPHTRFVHFPRHTHNYIEMIYMCSGETTHIIGGRTVVLHTGELLLLSQHAVQEILPAGRKDIAVNFIILPEFFDQTISMLGAEESLLKEFIVNCLRSGQSPEEYLHFKVSDVLPVQNLIENLVWTITNNIPNKRFMNQITMGLLFVQLMNHTDKMESGGYSYEQEIMIRVLEYVEEHYRDGELTVLANELNCEFTWLSRMIRQQTGFTYTELLQTKRLRQACLLLSSTTMSVADISLAVGYQNFSYFHRIFREKFHTSPKKWRDSCDRTHGE